ncbi:hypothetical protein ACFL2V_10770 [Pseudomonadota bacterium]
MHYTRHMHAFSYIYKFLTITLTIVLFGGCASTPPSLNSTTWLYGVHSDSSQFSRHTPIIAINDGEQSFNHIGKAIARYNEKGKEEILITTGQASFYTDQQTFQTARGNYTNLIYRFHFPRVPYRLIPFYLTAGKNGGLLVIVTLNEQEQPILFTTVHTCGCYLAMLPSNFLPEDAYPENWPTEQQHVYGETLPVRLNFPEPYENEWQPLIHLRSGTHRVMDVSVVDIRKQTLTEVNLLPVEQLYQLPLDSSHTSFFHMDGRNKGYVKGSVKPWERLLMSWWALDWRIGSDKALEPSQENGAVFYTSLKPWQRKASNLADFPRFLTYWGWRL